MFKCVCYWLGCVLVTVGKYACSVVHEGLLTRAGHGAGVSLSAVEAPLTHTLGGLVLVRVAVRRALHAVRIHGRGLVEARAAGCRKKIHKRKDVL